MTKLEEFFEVLRDYEWHPLREVAEAIKIEFSKVVEIAKLFSKVGIIHYDEERGAVKINEEWGFLVGEKRVF